MIGRDRIDGAVRESLLQGVQILGLPQGWVHLAGGVVPDDRGIGQQQVMWRHLAGDREATALRFAHDAHRAERG